MALLSDYTTKLRMAFDRQLPAEARAFAPTFMVNNVAAQHLGTSSAPDYDVSLFNFNLLEPKTYARNLTSIHQS